MPTSTRSAIILLLVDSTVNQTALQYEMPSSSDFVSSMRFTFEWAMDCTVDINDIAGFCMTESENVCNQSKSWLGKSINKVKLHVSYVSASMTHEDGAAT